MIFSMGILAISLSLDAFGVGAAYGLRKIKIPLTSKIVICIFSILYSGLSIIAGKSLSSVLSEETGKFIGIFILLGMGVWIFVQNLVKNPDKATETKQLSEEKTLLKLGIKSLGITIQIIKNPIEGDIDKSGIIDMRESLLLGLALSVDAIGVGVGSALSGFHSMAIPVTVGICQLCFLYMGSYAGQKFAALGKGNNKTLALLPGILLILLALLRI